MKLGELFPSENYLRSGPMESFRKIRSFIAGESVQKDYREFNLYGTPEIRFKSNVVRTSRYNLLSFVPLNLLLQFTKPANIYFLAIGILQIIPSISLSGSVPTIALPLTIVVIANMIKDAVEDYKRHLSDDKENSQAVSVVNPLDGALLERKWKDVRVGDVILIRNYQACPSDIILLASSEQSGVSFVETSNLDGETNLKLKTVPKELDILGVSGIPVAKDAAFKLSQELTSCEFRCQLPNNQLYQFEGSMKLISKSAEDIEAGTGSVGLGLHNMILRGCMLRNTEWVLGAVIYTGHETKIQMNSRAAPRKVSSLEELTGKFIWIAFWIQLVLCFIGAIVYGVIASSSSFQSRLYLGLSGLTASEVAGKAVLKFFSYIILFSNFIPISLMVTMAIVKLFQSQTIQADRLMKQSTIVRSSDLNEELGQIEFVFSDKTGTLTCNKMEFRKACVSGITYGEGLTEIRRNVLKKLGMPVPEEPQLPSGAKETPNVNFVDNRLQEVLDSKQPSAHFNDLVMFFFSLAANHSVMVESADHPAFSASSPDEGALTYGALHFGFEFRGRDTKNVIIKLPNKEKLVIEQLAVFDFDSTRKRSSLVCRCYDPRILMSTGEKVTKTFLLIKGADSVMVPRLSQSSANRPETKTMLAEMEVFAVDGLRTLCIGYREIPNEWAKTWLMRYEEARTSLTDREKLFQNLAAEVETDIELIGISAIEDKLQTNVAGTIDSLRAAGIKVWMLTGDKLETAINIGFATSLINAAGMYRVILSGEGDMKESLTRTLAEFDQIVGTKKGSVTLPAEAEGASEVAIIVDGGVLGKILSNEETRNLFSEVACMCASVICCRVTPEQKGSVVRLIREKHNKVTLAIGDGANDCNMIQSAHVGVGIRGVEGMQAFNASDYGVTEFQFLAPLLLIHGRWAYRRIAKLVLYMFYKNIVIVLPSYFLNLTISLFSGQRLFEELMYQVFNVVFTALPVIIFGIFEQDINKKDCMDFPQLYRVGPERIHARRRTFAQWILTGVWHSICIFYIPYLATTGTEIINADGVPSDIYLLGTYCYLAIVVVVNVKLVLEAYYLNALFVTSILVSVGLWFFVLYVLEIMPAILPKNGVKPDGVNMSPNLAGVGARLYSSPMTFFILFATCTFALMRDFVFKAFRFRFRSRDYHIIMASLSSKMREKQRTDAQAMEAARELSRLKSVRTMNNLSVFTENDPGSIRLMMSRTKRFFSERLSNQTTPVMSRNSSRINRL